MTDFGKIVNYYNTFDEWSRLETPEGRLEFEIVIKLVQEHLPHNSCVFDLGGGPGRYTFELAKSGHTMFLGDLSPKLIETAKEKAGYIAGKENIKRIEVVNALDLYGYENEMFDAVLLFGPLYHLTDSRELLVCLEETSRVLKPKGFLFVSYIPWLSGLSGIVERAFYAPGQVNAENLLKTFSRGIFNNSLSVGFQEGCYWKTNDLLDNLERTGFDKILLRSIRGLGYGREKHIIELKDKNEGLFNTMMTIVDETSTDINIVETCGHALYIGQKKQQ